MVGDTVREAVQASEERLKQYVHGVVQASEERLTQQIQDVRDGLEATNRRLDASEAKLSADIRNLHESLRRSMDDTEKMAVQITVTVERIERLEG